MIPGLTGHFAQLLNGIGAVAGSLALSSAGDWKTATFWLQVALTFAAAAGVHDLASFWGLFKQNGSGK
jgi:zinc transporter ZupT